MKLLLAENKDFSSNVIKKLDKMFDLTIAPNNFSQQEFQESFSYFDIIWLRLKFNLNQINNIKKNKCKILVCPVTGIDHLNPSLCSEIGIKIISLKGHTEFLKNIRATAEHTIFLSMALMRNSINSYEDVLKGNWNRDYFRGNELFKKKVGILGYGRLGEIVAKYYNSFGCEVFVFDKKKFEEKSINVSISKSIEDLISNTDILTIHLDLNATTHGLINWNLIKKMKKNIFIINTSRGEIINEFDVLKGLETKIISGIASDVLDNEFEFNKSLLFKNFIQKKHNIILTPHIGGNTFESFRRTEDFVFKQLIKETK